MLKIGLSACFNHADPQRALFKGKTLVYMEESMAQWVQESGAFPVLIPREIPSMTLRKIVGELDGLILQGGDDVSPLNYGEKPMHPKWQGDGVRDTYEIALIRESIRQKKPVLGICRGAQILNVAFGGSLYQDIQTQLPGAIVHRNWEIYDDNLHEVEILASGNLAKWLKKSGVFTTTTVHHQAIKELADGFKVEAMSVKDGIIEAIRWEKAPFVVALQWHPEFRRNRKAVLDARPILAAFLAAARAAGRSTSKRSAPSKSRGRSRRRRASTRPSGKRKSARTRRG